VGHGLRVIGLVLIAAACSGGEVICEPAVFATADPNPDARASTSDDIDVWGLFYPPTFDDIVGQPVEIQLPGPDSPLNNDAKVVWRATGEGEFSITAAGPNGQVVPPVWVDKHLGSLWDRPGEEWGTGWDFPEAGCWTFTIVRGDDEAEISIEVLPAG